MKVRGKLKEILIFGGLGWGVPFVVFVSILRWIEYKAPVFNSYAIFIAVSFLGGCFFELILQNLDRKQEELKFNVHNFYKSILTLAVFLFIYAIIFRFLLVPFDLATPFISSITILSLFLLAIYMLNKFIIKKASI